MLRTYFKFAFRTFWKDRFYALLNVVGLATGIAVSIIILLYLQSDLTYDQHHEKHEQIYRLVTNVKGPGVEFHPAKAAREVAPMLADDYPEVLNFVRIEEIRQTLVTVPHAGGERYNEEQWVYADSSMFSVFTHLFLAGDPATALRDKHSVVLTAALAQKYFGEQTALGQTLLLHEEQTPHTVTGVIEDLPDNTHLTFDALVSHVPPRQWFSAEAGEFVSESIWNPDVYTYLLFPEGYQPEAFFEKLPPFYDQYIRPFGDQVSARLWFYLEPLADVHFYSQQSSDEAQGNIAYIYTFAGIGLAILLLACINYMNMATARSGSRGKEVGVRKVLGSSRRSLFFAFLGESLLLSLIGLVLALGLVELILVATPFNELVQKELALDLFHNPVLLGGTLGITLVVGILSGVYPALYLPAVSPARSLKGHVRSSVGNLRLRKALVTLQFVISIAVVICTFLMRDQLDFMRNTDLGFDQEHLLLVTVQDTLTERQLPVIRQQLQAHPQVLGVTTSYHAPGFDMGQVVMRVETDSTPITQAFNVLSVGADYLQTMDIALTAGRDFHADISRDTRASAFIVNEAAARQLGWYQPTQPNATPADALDKEIGYFHGEDLGRVVGVVRDFNVTSLHNAIEPTVLIPIDEGNSSYLYLRLSGKNLPQTIADVREQWAEYDPDHPFEYTFLDEAFNEQYQADERQSGLITVLSGICLLISLLGILGLSAYTAERRTKEIGVRKVLGANVAQIVYLLFSDVMYLILVAGLVAAPLAYLLMRYWVQDFAYRAEPNALLYGLVAMAALLFAFLTMSFHSLKTARRNPVDSLRNE